MVVPYRTVCQTVHQYAYVPCMKQRSIVPYLSYHALRTVCEHSVYHICSIQYRVSNRVSTSVALHRSYRTVTYTALCTTAYRTVPYRKSCRTVYHSTPYRVKRCVSMYRVSTSVYSIILVHFTLPNLKPFRVSYRYRRVSGLRDEEGGRGVNPRAVRPATLLPHPPQPLGWHEQAGQAARQQQPAGKP